MQDLGEVAVRCMCELIVSLPHFNFRNNTLAVIVPLMITKTLGGKVHIYLTPPSFIWISFPVCHMSLDISSVC